MTSFFVVLGLRGGAPEAGPGALGGERARRRGAIYSALAVAIVMTMGSCESTLEDLGLIQADEVNALLSITVTSDAQVIELDSTQQFNAEGSYQNGTTAELTDSVEWASDDETVATIDESGLAAGLAKGFSTITATIGSVEGESILGVFGPPDDPQPFSNVGVIVVPEVTTAGDFLTVNIPADAISMGIILRGSNTNFKMVDHGIHLRVSGGNLVYTTNPAITTLAFITGPDGSPVPLSFNQIDPCFFVSNIPCGTEESLGDNLVNYHAPAPFFPNDGNSATLAAGDYTFPIASFDTNGAALESDILSPFVLYKTSSPAGQTMRINLFVVSGVASGITTAAEAEADPEIVGAIAVLRNVYETRVGLNLDVTVDIVPDSRFVTLDTQEEQDDLLRSFPIFSPSNAMSLFIVGELDYLPGGVIGYSAGIPGPFNLDGTVVSGTLAEYQGDGNGTILGFTLAHEFGHYVGLWHTSQTDGNQGSIIGHDPIADTPECTDSHLGEAGDIDQCPDRDNLMFPVVDLEPDPPISANQTTVILLNPAVGVP